MGLDGYQQYLPEIMKILNSYILKSKIRRNFRNTSGKEQTGVAFAQTQDKDKKLKKDKTTRESHIYFTVENKATVQ